ncbi:hypothetical protein Nepgr_016392 [Nepenthes gracilis]|uniref:Uncharacterized protein n=1 Tax=Nepenthes gracilis TaxID=150966 RepID=A0AAD3XS91_NEPGR|nr:hypothetical protein Nepgr_016392 [Nepenthes gracilis]
MTASPLSPSTGNVGQCRSLLRTGSLAVLGPEPSFVAIPSALAEGLAYLDVIPNVVLSSHERAYNGMKAEQITKPKNLASGVDGVGSGTTSQDSHSADRKTLSVKLRPEIEQPSCQTFGFNAHSLEWAMDNQEERMSTVGITEACHVVPISKDYLAEGGHSLPS